MTRTGLKNHDAIAREWEEAEILEPMPTTIHSWKQILRDMQRHVNEIVQNSYETREKERRRKIEMLSASTNAKDQAQVKRLRN